jgi:DNA-binding IclR family transcriptional regulator
MSSTDETRTWTFLTNHAQVLLCLAEDPDIRLRDVAERVGITERACQRILAELVEAGYVTVTRVGRRNRYTVDREHAMRHSAQLGHDIGTLLEALGTSDTPTSA